jgi:hypothetical protein
MVLNNVSGGIGNAEAKCPRTKRVMRDPVLPDAPRRRLRRG